MHLSYAKVLVCVARADDTLHPEEIAALDRALEVVPASAEELADVRALLDVSRHVDADAILHGFMEALRNTGTGRGSVAAHLAELVRDCYVLAAVDGEISAKEIGMIERLLEVAGIPPTRRATLHQWAEVAARQTIDGLGLFLDCLAEDV